MKIKKFDVVRLEDGREGTIVDVSKNPTAYLVATNEDDVSSWPTVASAEIVEIVKAFDDHDNV